MKVAVTLEFEVHAESPHDAVIAVGEMLDAWSLQQSSAGASVMRNVVGPMSIDARMAPVPNIMPGGRR